MFCIDKVLNTGIGGGWGGLLILFNGPKNKQLKLEQIPLRNCRNRVEIKSPCDEIHAYIYMDIFM